MKTIIIKESESNIKINKYLNKLLPNCSTNLLYKLIRKNYFKINDIKVKGDELLKTGDIISIFLGDETYDSFVNTNINSSDALNLDLSDIKKRIVFENDNVIIFNKTEGELSQKDNENSVSINEKLRYYLKIKNFDSSTYKPSVINRLDINTKGLIVFAKTYLAANVISKLFNERKIQKYYFTFINGILNKYKDTLYGKYKKDTKNNKAYISLISDYKESDKDIVITEYEIIKYFSDYTAINIHLITGKSHQIRAHFSSINHPLICDKKYMDEDLYNKNKLQFKRKYQDLTCYKIVFPNFTELEKIGLNNKTFLINYGDIDKYEKI